MNPSSLTHALLNWMSRHSMLLQKHGKEMQKSKDEFDEIYNEVNAIKTKKEKE